MPIPLLKLPSLASYDVLGEMDLLDVFILSTLSKRMRKIIRESYARQPIVLLIDQGFVFKVGKVNNGKHEFTMNMVNQENLEAQEHWLLHFQNSGEVPMTNKDHNEISTYWKDVDNKHVTMMEYFLGIFPELKINIIFSNVTTEKFKDVMRFVNQASVTIGFVQLLSRGPIDNADELAISALNECQTASRLKLNIRVTENFNYDYHSHEPFKFDDFAMIHADWFTANHFVNLLMDCKKVLLSMPYNERDCKLIFQRWIEGSQLENIHSLLPAGNLSGVFSNMQDAVVPVEKVKIREKYRRFDDGQCYTIQQKNGGLEAIVYVETFGLLNLTTDFELITGDDRGIQWLLPFRLNAFNYDESEEEQFRRRQGRQRFR